VNRKPPRRLSLKQVDEEAQKFFKWNKNFDKIPVPIEDIVCRYYKYDIIPSASLYSKIGAAGFILPHKKEIYIEQSIFENTSPNRFNSTLAHEVGHLVLHREFMDKFKDEDDVISFLTSFESDPDSLDWIEKQAWTYARYLLLPSHFFDKKLFSLIDEKKLNDSPARDISTLLKIPIATHFEVAEEMAKIRIQKFLENGV